MLILNRPKVGAAGGALGTACLPGGKEPSWASPLTSSVLFCRLSRAALPPRPAHHEISIPSTKRPPAGSNSPRRKSRPANEEEFGSCREWKGRSSVTPPGSPSLWGGDCDNRRRVASSSEGDPVGILCVKNPAERRPRAKTLAQKGPRPQSC
jgi:hypothetical protein